MTNELYYDFISFDHENTQEIDKSTSKMLERCIREALHEKTFEVSTMNFGNDKNTFLIIKVNSIQTLKSLIV